ncbi:MAG: hypothetical protein JWM80_6627 [Cyanobacteria bacterium RYN_339]|nr:hypothetical protein [Cyanobacteria bacterium RYN_339]
MLQACTSTASAIINPSFGSLVTSATSTYGGLTLGVPLDQTSQDLGISFAPPNVVLTARAPHGRTDSIDYLVTRDEDTHEVFHVIGDQSSAAFSVHVPMLRFRAGDYTIKVFVPDEPTPFGKSALHITSDLLDH